MLGRIHAIPFSEIGEHSIPPEKLNAFKLQVIDDPGEYLLHLIEFFQYIIDNMLITSLFFIYFSFI